MPSEFVDGLIAGEVERSEGMEYKSKATLNLSRVGINEMTLRDYFAAQALLGVVKYEPSRAAKDAYAIADAMLIERGKPAVDQVDGQCAGQ